MKGGVLFVAGTDTGVGKTVVTAALALAARGLGLKAGVMKPFACGGDEDLLFLREAAGVDDPTEDLMPISFRAPRSPEAAARLEGREVDLGPVWTALERLRSRYQLLLVEGVGGVRVPLRPGYELRDFIRETRAPALVVARSGLGTLNHTALTVEALLSRDIPVLGFVLNDGAAPVDDSLATENAWDLKAMTGLACLGRVRPDPGVLAGHRAVSEATVAALRVPV